MVVVVVVVVVVVAVRVGLAATSSHADTDPRRGALMRSAERAQYRWY